MMTLERRQNTSCTVKLVTCPQCGQSLDSESPKSHLLNKHDPADFDLGDAA